MSLINIILCSNLNENTSTSKFKTSDALALKRDKFQALKTDYNNSDH